MQINDKIYGDWEITDPLIIELINSRPFQRLKNITNDGANRYLFKVGNISRYEHSLGVLYITQRFSDKREDQVMAVLHDIAHTAFSHVVDFVFEKGDTQDTHEDAKKKVFKGEINQILQKYGYEAEQFYEKEGYPIVGSGGKEVNADRVDYFMRDGNGINSTSPELIKLYIDSLYYDKKSEEFYFKDAGISGSFALSCLNTSLLAYLSAISIGSYYLLSAALRKALEIGLIQEVDLMGTDNEIMEKLINSKDDTIQKYITKMNKTTRYEFCAKEEAEYSTKNKVRYVNPKIRLQNGEIKYATEVVSNFKDIINDFEKNYSEVHIRQVI